MNFVRRKTKNIRTEKELCDNKEIGWEKGKREIEREKKEKRKISWIEKGK